MFEKLLSALPFNPGTLQQLSFYYKRVRAEESVRRIGLVFIVLAFLIQFFAIASPPQSTLADSPNDLVNGGFSSAAEAASDCRSNLEDYGTILAYYGITCDQVAKASTVTIKSTDFNGQLWSMGRQPESLNGETTVSIPGLGYPLYVRYLKAWDGTGPPSTYQMLNVTTAGGQSFYLMYACGNLASVGFPQPVQQPPNLAFSKTTVPGSPAANSTVTPGTVLEYRLMLTNTGGTANDVYITDNQPKDVTEVWLSTGHATTSWFGGDQAGWYFVKVPAGAAYSVDVHFKVNPSTPNNTKICNVATIKADTIASKNSNEVCFSVKLKAPTPPTTPPVTPQSTCQQQLSSQNQSACINVKKAAANLTEDISNANGTTAKAGDLIQYSLTATNVGSSTVSSYVFSDSLAYVLDYSTIVSNGGGELNASDEIVWPSVSIKPAQSLTKTFEVKVDNPLPQTPASTSDPSYFNLKMTNTFGNTVVINLPPSPTQSIQSAATALPNTGPGSSALIGALVVAVAGFFFYRSRLLVKETKLAINESSGGGNE